MKRLAIIFGIMCVGVIVLLETSNKKNKHHKPGKLIESDPEDVWWG